jgi:hypothetical protein
MNINIIGDCKNSKNLKDIVNKFQVYDDFKAMSDDSINVLVSNEPKEDVHVWYTEKLSSKVNYIEHYYNIMKQYNYRYLVVKNVENLGPIKNHLIFYGKRIKHYSNEIELNLALIDLLGSIEEL